MIKRLLKRLLPHGIRVFFTNAYILGFDFGQVRSAQRGSPINREGQPIPWYTYPAIEYINRLDFREKKIFEYGSGNSTLYWAQRCKRLASVEDDHDWFKQISSKLPSKVHYQFLPEREDYVHSIQLINDNFDVVIIDGSYRYECVQEAIKKISENAVILLDNSDWYPEAAKVLRDANLIQIDMAGFGPINNYTWTTSFFLTRAFRFKAEGGRQPGHGVGSLPHKPVH
jgi:hypothetical protein